MKSGSRSEGAVTLALAHRVLLGLFMLIPGLIQLYAFGPEGVSVLFSSFGFPFPLFWAWILIGAQLLAGLALLARYRVSTIAWIPVVVVSLTLLLIVIKWGDVVHTNLSSLLLHLIALVGYIQLLSDE